MTRLLPILSAALALAACGKPADDGVAVTFNTDGGQVRGAIGGNQSGAVKIDLPGFKGELALPTVRLNADDFELNGVHLYPGSTIESVDVGGGNGLRLRFTSPAGATEVRDWFGKRLGEAGFTLRSEGGALVGTDDENKPFRMDLTDTGDAATGTIVIGR